LTFFTLSRVRVKTSFPFSMTIRPWSPQTSRRFVPGASPVLVTKWPIAPLGYCRIALISSSTSIGCVLPINPTAVSLFGIMPVIHWIRSRLCGHWLMSTPPPSPAHVARQPPEA
jgi:hypothetical protein